MIAVFPINAAAELASGSTAVRWPREFYLYGAWLIPAFGGLLVGYAIRSYQARTRDGA